MICTECKGSNFEGAQCPTETYSSHGIDSVTVHAVYVTPATDYASLPNPSFPYNYVYLSALNLGAYRTSSLGVTCLDPLLVKGQSNMGGRGYLISMAHKLPLMGFRVCDKNLPGCSQL